jgi:AraC-like DNA-binding protein
VAHPATIAYHRFPQKARDMMMRITSPLVAINIHSEHRDAVSRAALPITDVSFIDAGELGPLLANRQPVAGFLIELSTDRPADTDAMIQETREARPATPIVACAAPHEDSAPLFVRAVQAGADYVSLFRFEDLERGVRTAFAATLTAPMHAEAAHRVLPWIPSPAQPLISWCTMGAASRLTVTMAAETLRVSDRTLYRLMRGLHLPTPEATIGWCRLFVATHMIATRHQHVERVAEALGFGSGSQLRNMFKRYTGLTLAAVHDAQPVAWLAQLYCTVPRAGAA